MQLKFQRADFPAAWFSPILSFSLDAPDNPEKARTGPRGVFSME